MMMQFWNYAFVGAAAVLSGCAVVQVQPQGRVASDQLLISLATEDTVRALAIKEVVGGQNVRLTVANIGNVEQDLGYVTAALRARILQEGGRLVAETDKQSIEVVAMIQSIGSDSDHSSVGIPIPLPALGSVAITELSFYSSDKQIARCRMWLYAVDVKGNLIFTHQPVHTAHRVNNPTLLGVTLGKFSDVDELDHAQGRVPITEPGLTR